jgi:hypothetical protein
MTMMHANIVKLPVPELPDQCVRQLTAADRDYFRRRAAQEADAANLSSCTEAKMAHEELEAAYRLLCSTRRDLADPRPTSELAIFPSKGILSD